MLTKMHNARATPYPPQHTVNWKVTTLKKNCVAGLNDCISCGWSVLQFTTQGLGTKDFK